MEPAEEKGLWTGRTREASLWPQKGTEVPTATPVLRALGHAGRGPCHSPGFC